MRSTVAFFLFFLLSLLFYEQCLHVHACHQTGKLIQHDNTLCPVEGHQPTVSFFTTGGTIATNTGGSWGALDAEELISRTRGISNVANVHAISFSNVGSHDLDTPRLFTLAKLIQAELDDPLISGVVVAMGTDSLEGAAYLLSLLIQSESPLVIVAAMLPANELGADGPMSLFNAIVVAASPKSRSKGSLVVFHHDIMQASSIYKSSINRLEPFETTHGGMAGSVHGLEVTYYTTSKESSRAPLVDIRKHQGPVSLPRVEVLFVHVDSESDDIESLLKRRVNGIILAGIGGGWAPSRLIPLFENLSIPVVVSHQGGSGLITGSAFRHTSGLLRPQQSRYLLMLCLMVYGTKEEVLRCSDDRSLPG